MRILAIDLGDVRTGLAAGEDITGTVEPLRVLEERNHEKRFKRLTAEVEAFGPDLILVGFPLNMDDSEGPRAKASREFSEQLFEYCGIPVKLQDERLTSFAADERLRESGRTRKGKKKVQDAIAAAELIHDYLGGP